MPTVGAVIEELEQRGVVFSVEAGKIKFRAPNKSALPQEAIAALRDRKPEAIAFLNGRMDNRIKNALAESCRNYPEGMIAWLEAVHPAMYHQLVTVPLDEWTENVNVAEFDKVLDAWVAAHRAACELYLAAKDTTSL
jgi:hypothetical protein